MSSERKSEPNRGFVKNEQLCRHYHTIGLALLAYEREAPVLLRSLHERAAANFRVACSFLPDSILDSYLEDLLDLSVTDKDLFIATSGFSPRRLLVAFPFAGLLSAVGLGFYLSTLDLPYSFCVAVILLCSIPFALLWEWVPRSTNRRLFFARLIAAELSNRRGHRVSRNSKNRFEIKDALVPSLGREAMPVSTSSHK